MASVKIGRSKDDVVIAGGVRGAIVWNERRAIWSRVGGFQAFWTAASLPVRFAWMSLQVLGDSLALECGFL